MVLFVSENDGNPFLWITLEHLLEGGGQRVGSGLCKPRKFRFETREEADIFAKPR